MTPSTRTALFTFAEFLARYQDNPRYELADGEIIDMEPTGPHEAVGDKLATKIGIAIETAQLPWFIPRTCLLRPFADIATARRPDVIVLDETAIINEPQWVREPVITLASSVKLVVEVVSTNWETDYCSEARRVCLIGHS